MSDEKKSDHWKDLASILGAEIPPEEPEAPAPIEEPGLGPQAAAEGGAGVLDAPAAELARPTLPLRPKRSPVDWNRLASELGVEVPPEPEAPTQAEARPGEGAEAEPVQEGSVSLPEDLTPPFQELETPSEILSEARAAEAEPAEAAEPMEAAEAPAEERRGRRHRKRRRRSRYEEPAHSAEGTEGAEAAEIAPRRGPEEDAAGRRRLRHRRRGRGRDRRPGEEAEPRESFAKGLEPVTGEPGVPRQLPEDADEEADLAGIAAEEGDVSEGQEATGGEPAAAADKASHRAIPSWGEAINYIISANLESRARNPDRRASSRSRGNRNHGGRERSSDRPD